MSYEKTIWKHGDTVTAEKLNKIEEGIASASVSGGSKTIIYYHYTQGHYTTDQVANLEQYIGKVFLVVLNSQSCSVGSAVVYIDGESGFVINAYDSVKGYKGLFYFSLYPWINDIDCQIADESSEFADMFYNGDMGLTLIEL